MIYEVIKRTIDILGAIFLLILFFPIMLIAAIAVKLTSQGPLLVEKTNKSSIRVGKYGKKFYLYKFRSMIVGAHELLHNDPKYKDLLKEYQRSSYKLHHDPRLTPIGKFLRKHSIDEMPQLFNVLEGKMSIVGPRAYLPDELEKQQKKYPKTKELVKELL